MMTTRTHKVYPYSHVVEIGWWHSRYNVSFTHTMLKSMGHIVHYRPHPASPQY